MAVARHPQLCRCWRANGPRNVSWLGAARAALWRLGEPAALYVLGLAFLVAGRSSVYLMLAMSVLLIAVGWAYTQICRLYPDGGGVLHRRQA